MEVSTYSAILLEAIVEVLLLDGVRIGICQRISIVKQRIFQCWRIFLYNVSVEIYCGKFPWLIIGLHTIIYSTMEPNGSFSFGRPKTLELGGLVASSGCVSGQISLFALTFA